MSEELWCVFLPAREGLCAVTAGVLIRNGKVVRAAPILHWTVGKSSAVLRGWVKSKCGEIEEIVT